MKTKTIWRKAAGNWAGVGNMSLSPPPFSLASLLCWKNQGIKWFAVLSFLILEERRVYLMQWERKEGCYTEKQEEVLYCTKVHRFLGTMASDQICYFPCIFLPKKGQFSYKLEFSVESVVITISSTEISLHNLSGVKLHAHSPLINTWFKIPHKTNSIQFPCIFRQSFPKLSLILCIWAKANRRGDICSS